MSLCHIQASQWRAAPNKKGAPSSRAPARRRSGRQHNPHRASRSLRRPPYYHYPPSHAVARRPLPASMPLHPGCLSVRPACVTTLSLYRVPCARVRPFPPCGSSARLHPCAIFHLDIFHAHAYGLPPPWAQTARGQSYENLPLSGNRTDIPSIPVHESHRAKARCAALSIFPFISLSLAAAFHNCHQKARRRRHRCRSPVAAQIFNGRGFTHGSAVAAATAVTGGGRGPGCGSRHDSGNGGGCGSASGSVSGPRSRERQSGRCRGDLAPGAVPLEARAAVRWISHPGI